MSVCSQDKAHCSGLGRVLMRVPGPFVSPGFVGTSAVLGIVSGTWARVLLIFKQ